MRASRDLQWVIDAYALSLAALLLTGGSLADLFGRRLVFVLGLGIFTGASLLCGLAGSPLTLNLARGVQGIGGALMFATALALLANAFPGRERGTAFGLWGATTGAAVAVGPLVGGVLTEWLGWEYIFFVNVPIGIGAIFMTLSKVEESRSPAEGRVDWRRAGDVLRRAAVPLVFALIRGNAEGWSVDADRRAARRPRSCCWSPSWSSSAASGCRCSTSRCSATRPSTARRSPRSCCRRRCSRCSST